jgi:hypothetical protein
MNVSYNWYKIVDIDIIIKCHLMDCIYEGIEYKPE